MTPQTSEARSAGLLRIGNTLLDLIFPPRCTGCGKVDYRWCLTCQQTLEETPVVIYQEQVSEQLQVATTALHSGIIQHAIHALKYENMRQMTHPLGKRMADVLETLNWRIDTIAPVPLHTTRFAERGYNQAKELGDRIASLTSIPCIDVVLRQRATRSQVTLNREERLMNMQEAFLANTTHDDHIRGKTILIVDDVFTTGATLSEVSKALLDAGAKTTHGLTITTASAS